MRVLVTGSSGFIGGHLVSALAALGHHVTGLDRRPPFDGRDIPMTLRTLPIDLSQPDNALWDALAAVDVVIHLAARASQGPSWSGFNRYVADNVLGTHHLLEALVAYPRPLVLVSSSSVYGIVTGEEGAPLMPISPYGVTKVAAEALAHAYASSHGLDVSVVRPFSIYGPWQREDMLHRSVIRRLLRGAPVIVHGDGSQARSFTYVDDLVELLARAANESRRAPRPGRFVVYNAASQEAHTVMATVMLLGGLLGIQPEIELTDRVVGDQRSTAALCEAARYAFNWRATTPYEVGLEKMVAWQRAYERVVA